MSLKRNERAAPLSERNGPTSSRLDGPDLSVRKNQAPARSAAGIPRSVDLHIEELVLHGFEPAARHAIGDALERELSRLLTEPGSSITFTEDFEIPRLNGGTCNVPPGAHSEATGIQLARAIYGGMVK